MKSIVLLLASFLLFAVTGCAGQLGDVKTSHEQGQTLSRVYNASADQAYAAAVAVMREEHADDPIEEHASEHFAMGKRSSSVIPWRYGALVGVWVRDAGPGRAQVDVVTRRTGSTWFIGLTQGTFQEEIAAKLAAAR